MIETARLILSLLDPREKKLFYLLLPLFIFAALVDVAGVASIAPFILVVSNPQSIETNAALSYVHRLMGSPETNTFILYLAGFVFVSLLGSIGVKALSEYAVTRFGSGRTLSISTRLLRTYLAQPYSWFLDRHSADLGKNILVEVDQVVKGVVVPSMRVLSQAFVVIFLLALIIATAPSVAFAVFIIVGGSFGGIYVACRKFLLRNGVVARQANLERYQIAQESMAGIKEVKVLGLEEAHIRRFRAAADRLARCDRATSLVQVLPIRLLELMVFGSVILLIVLFIVVKEQRLDTILPILGLFAFAGYRIMPALNMLFTSAAQVQYYKAMLTSMSKNLEDAPAELPNLQRSTERLPLRREIKLTNITYTYPKAERPSLRGLSITLPAKKTFGFVGKTGAGKSTTVDLILGLLQPDSGTVEVDGVAITNKNVRSWQRSIGYVAQQIFLADDTIASNIAFGVPEDEIDMAAVERAARIAMVHDFVVSKLPQGYRTIVGERGVRLSGGERQRIGIARALYHDPDVLVLDEATSALDNVTERAVMDAIHNIGRSKTIILIAHRLTTVRACDAIFVLEEGGLGAQGTYDELLVAGESFREMAIG
jgi:ABC-type multidrug transport system fused ATPase/permease subunit